MASWLAVWVKPECWVRLLPGHQKPVIEQLIADYDFLGGFGYIIAGAGPGNSTHEQTVKHMTLFQTEVMPALKKYHAQKIATQTRSATV